MAPRSTTDLLNIESLPAAEVTKMMHFFAHTSSKPYKTVLCSDKSKRMYWLEDPTDYRDLLATYERLLKVTFYETSIGLKRYRSTDAPNGVRPVLVVDGIWTDYPFMMDRVLNLGVYLKYVTGEKTPTEVFEVLMGQVKACPRLERMLLLVQKLPYEDKAEDVVKFLIAPLRAWMEESGVRLIIRYIS